MRALGFAGLAAALATALAACTVGPDYHRPAIATPAAFAEAIPTDRTAISPADADLSAWWTGFNDPRLSSLIARARQAHVSRILTFGEKAGSDARLTGYDESGDGAIVKADIAGTPVEFRIGAPGRHIAGNAVAALLAVATLEGDVLNAAAALKGFAALKGRGARFSAGGVDVIDESYNANTASMAAALALLGAAKGRRIAVLGDMLEMGADGAAHHASLAAPIEAARADLVFLCGPQMRSLWDVLPASRRGAWAPTSSELAPQLTAALHPGDTVLVKGSNGSKMSVVIEALKARVA